VLIIPAIDLKGGRCVRLWQGKEDKETVYWEDPLVVAKRWVEKGAQRLHLVDLDGALKGKPVHLEIVEKIVREVDVPIEFGGGIRDKAILEEVFAKGIDYAILGSRALSLDFVKDACIKFENRIIVSIDVRQDKVLAEGWVKETSLRVENLVKGLVKAGVKTIIFTDVTRDGTLRGIDIRLIKKFLKIANIEVIIAGGIASLRDIRKVVQLGDRGPMGVIIGKALYDGKIKLEEAIAIGA